MIFLKPPITYILFVVILSIVCQHSGAQQCYPQCHNNGTGWNSQLNVTSLDYDGAIELIWQYNTTDDQYIVMHRLIGSLNYTVSSPMNSTSHTLTGLLGESVYEVKVCLAMDPINCGNCQQCYNTSTYLPSQIEQSSASVFEGQRESGNLSVLLTWTRLTAEQAGGVLTSYIISLYNQPSGILSRKFFVSPRSTSRLLAPSDLMANQLYSFTVRASNSAGRGNESDEVMFNTNGPQPPMEFLAVDSEGVAGIIRNNQSIIEEGGFSTPFTFDNRNSTIYYIDSGKIFGMSLRNQNSWLLANMSEGVDNVMDITFDWITRTLYFATSNATQILMIWGLPLDNPLLEPVCTVDVILNDSKIFMTVSPFTGQLYWIEGSPSGTSLYQLNLNNSVTQLYSSNSRKRNVMCSQSGLDTIGGLTAALTYDVITDHLWLSTVMGDIWSCDLSGCDCIVRVNGTALLSSGDTLMDVGLPTDSVSLDSVNIYWSGPAGVFYVPRNNVILLSQLSSLNTSSIVTIDPGQQPLPEETCLFPAVNAAEQPLVECVNATNSTLQLRWFAPNITDQCEDQLVMFPTISYIVSHRTTTGVNSFTQTETFDEMIMLTNLKSFTEYTIQIQTVNIYTPPGTGNLQQTTCTTQPTVLPGFVTDVKVFPQSKSLNVTWSPPLFSSSEDGGDTFSNLMYTVELWEINNDSNGATIVSTTSNQVTFTELQPATPYGVTIAPIILGAMFDPLVYCVQTLDNVTNHASIIIATDTSVETMQIDNQSPLLLLINDTDTTGVTYDSQRDILYLVAEGYLSGLSQPNREGLNLPSKLVRVNDAGHIAVDFIGQRLYWIESGTMIKYIMIDDDVDSSSLLQTDEGISDLAVDSPSGLLFWAHNGGALRGISVMRLNGLGGRMICVSDSGQLYRYLAITVDTENKRIFWIKEVEGSFQIGVADYGSGSCINVVNKMISDKPNIQSTSDRRVSVVSMVYVAGVLLHTTLTSPNTIFITPSNFSSFPSTDYQLAIASYISIAPGINIRSITANQTSQQFLPDNVGLNVTTIAPSVPSNIHLDDSSNDTFINITWDMVEGVSPAIVSYEVTYSLSKIDGSIENETILKTSDNYFVLENQLPATTVNVSIRAYTRWFTSDYASPLETIVSDSRIPSQIVQSSVSVFRGERGSNELFALLTWTGLTAEQAGGILSNTDYSVSLYTQPDRTLVREYPVRPGSTSRQLFPSDLMANQLYSFTVRASNSAGRGNESDDVMFNTNGLQPPMEFLAVDSEGVAGIIRSNQSVIEEGRFSTPFTFDNRNSTLYYIKSGKVIKMPLRNPDLASILAGMSQSDGDILQITYDWITRVFYLSFSMVMVESSNEDRVLAIYSLPLDNPVFKMVHKVHDLSNDTQVVMTIAPRIGQLYWIETSPSGTSLYRLNPLNNNITQLYSSNSRKRNVMCSQSGLDTIGELTAALTYDVITDHLWVSTVMGDIWSCDLSGCDCIVRVNGTTLLSSGDTLMDVGLPTDSVSLDSVNIYWSGPVGVFYVPRNNVTLLSQLSNLNTSSIVTIDPGQQPLPNLRCLYPDFNGFLFLKCTNVTNSTISLKWVSPNVTRQCENELVKFPTLTYTVNFRSPSSMQEVMVRTFDLTAELTDLTPHTMHRIFVRATNPYTQRRLGQPESVTCTTLMNIPSVVRNLTVTAHSTSLLFAMWERPAEPGSNNAILTYYINLNGTLYNTTNDSTTSISILGLLPNTLYSIEVFADNSDSQGVGKTTKMDQRTWPLPPVPEILMIGNTSLVIRVPLGEIYEPLVNLSLIVKESSDQDIVRKNQSILLERLRTANKTVNQLIPNTEYLIQTHATYRMTGYNVNEDLILYSDVVRQKTRAGVPDVPDLALVNGSELEWTVPNNNGKSITSYTVMVDSSGAINMITVSNEMMSFDLATLMFPSGFQSNVTVQAVNDVGASNQSNTVSYNTTSLVTTVTSSPSSDIFSGGVMAGIIMACIIAGIFLIVLTMVICTCCCRSRSKKMDFYDFRIDLPYNNELRVLRMSQMRVANNELYMCDYSEEDLETLKQIPKENITLQKELGRGAFGEVWEGTAEDIMGPGTGTHRVAIKMLQKNAAEVDKRSFLSEALIMSNFNHLNVLPVLGVCLSNPFFLILELMEAGDLLAFLRGARPENGPPLLTVEELVKIALDVANGARYLETQHFVHRDLAARNCLVSSKGPDRVVKIGDFGLARDVYHSDYYRKEGQGLLPVRWMAPESLLDGKFTVDSDIWSYGILLWEITTLGRQPYPARSNQEVFQFVIGGGRCDKPDNCHPKLYSLMKSCWAHRPEDRPRFRSTVDALSRLHDRLIRRDSEYSDTWEESEEEDNSHITPNSNTMSSCQRNTSSSSGRSFRSSIRSGASFIATGIATLTRSNRLMNSLRNRASIHSLHRNVPNGNNYQTSAENLIENKDQNGFREIGPF